MNVNQNQSIWEQYEQVKASSGRCLKLVPGEKRTHQFNVTKIVIKEAEFEGKRTGGKTVESTVLDPR